MSRIRHGGRLAREREFHNDRFGAPDERKQDSYYFAVESASKEYWRLVNAAAAGSDVLEYGCSDGSNAIRLADLARHVTGIDISDVAIGQGQTRAKREAVTNIELKVGNAEAMDLPSASFDLVFGSGILHHLSLEDSLQEVRRVLRDGGKAIFSEPLGHNIAIRRYRDRTPEARTVDEHPLLKTDFDIVARHFSKSDLRFFGLSTLASIPFRASPIGPAIRGVGEAMDSILLKIPGLKWQAWIVVMVLEA